MEWSGSERKDIRIARLRFEGKECDVVGGVMLVDIDCWSEVWRFGDLERALNREMLVQS